MLKKGNLLRLDRLHKTEDLFKKHSWSLNDKRYANFCALAGQMNDVEFALLYELTDRFHLLEINNYIIEFLLGFYSSDDNLFEKSNNIYITPMKKVNAKGKHLKNKIKSGDTVYDEFQAKRKLCEYEEKFVFCRDASEILPLFAKNDLICFVDDFVGSGKTYDDTYKSFKAYFASCGKQIGVKDVFAITAWAMEEGFLYCNNRHLRLFCNKKFPKEITDFSGYTTLEKDEKIKLMEQMENSYGNNISPQYSLGYGRSEALVSILAKSPNNTFPIFWKAKYNKNIFPRF